MFLAFPVLTIVLLPTLTSSDKTTILKEYMFYPPLSSNKNIFTLHDPICLSSGSITKVLSELEKLVKTEHGPRFTFYSIFDSELKISGSL